MKIDEKWKKDDLRLKRITNKDLDCKNCIYRLDDSEKFGNTTRCKKFEKIKPVAVLKRQKCTVKETEK